MSTAPRLRAALRRQAAFMAGVAVLAVAAAMPYILRQRDQYVSSVTAAYDHRDALAAPMTTALASSRFAQLAATLRQRLEEPEFLWQVADAVELSLDGSGAGGDASLADDSSTKARVAALLTPTLRARPDDAAQTVTVVVRAEDPLTAKRLADAVMELFIQKELRFEAETAYRLHEAHQRFLEDARRERAKAGPPAGRETDDFLPRLEERVRELDLERRRLAGQIDRPAERTRLRLTVPATYDDLPVARPRRVAAAILAVAVSVLVGLAGTLREAMTPYARSAGRVVSATGLPVLAQVSEAVLRRFPVVDRERAVAWCESARVEPRSAPAVAAWHAYQECERAIARVVVGPVWLLAVPGGKGRTRAFVHNYLAVAGLDLGSTLLVIDGESRDPLGRPEDRRRVPGDLGRFLAGKLLWKEIRLNRTPERPYDLVYARPGDGNAPYSAAVLARLFTSLCRGYGRVLLRAHEHRHEVENAALAKAATDCLLVVDARHTRLAEVRRAREVLDPAKIRGVILLGT